MLPGWRMKEYFKEALRPDLQIQPAGFDMTVSKIFSFSSSGLIGLESKRLSDTREIVPVEGYWRLGQGGYKIRFNEIVSVPLDHAGLCLPRSSLLRMGATINCALWDPGYYGRGEALLTVYNPQGIIIEVGARIAQMVFIKLSDRAHKGYEGSYQGENIDK